MGTAILRGISAALLATLLTLLAGMLWVGLGFGGVNTSTLVDIGLIVSSVVAGYKAAREGGLWLLGGLAGAGYVGVAILLLALFYPISYWGAIQILGEGSLIGVVAGALGAGGFSERPYLQRPTRRSYSNWRNYSPRVYEPEPVPFEEEVRDSHVDDWNDEVVEDKPIYSTQPLRRGNSRWWEDEL